MFEKIDYEWLSFLLVLDNERCDDYCSWEDEDEKTYNEIIDYARRCFRIDKSVTNYDVVDIVYDKLVKEGYFREE